MFQYSSLTTTHLLSKASMSVANNQSLIAKYGSSPLNRPLHKLGYKPLLIQSTAKQLETPINLCNSLHIILRALYLIPNWVKVVIDNLGLLFLTWRVFEGDIKNNYWYDKPPTHDKNYQGTVYYIFGGIRATGYTQSQLICFKFIGTYGVHKNTIFPDS